MAAYRMDEFKWTPCGNIHHIRINKWINVNHLEKVWQWTIMLSEYVCMLCMCILYNRLINRKKTMDVRHINEIQKPIANVIRNVQISVVFVDVVHAKIDHENWTLNTMSFMGKKFDFVYIRIRNQKAFAWKSTQVPRRLTKSASFVIFVDGPQLFRIF